MVGVQSIQWLGFCAVGSVNRSILHFFPSAGPSRAPYSVSCALTVFGQGVESRTVMLEGARVGHPDGVDLGQAFPELSEKGGGYFGLGIELSTAQPRVDLSSSS